MKECEWSYRRSSSHGKIAWQPDEFSEVELINLNKEIGYEEKDDDLLEEVTLAKKKKELILNEL